MNEEEIAALVKILLTADGGCIFCGSDLSQKVCELFPQYRGQIETAFKALTRQDLYDV